MRALKLMDELGDVVISSLLLEELIPQCTFLTHQRSSTVQTETHVFPRNTKYRSLQESGLLSFCSDYKALNGFLVMLLIVNCYK